MESIGCSYFIFSSLLPDYQSFRHNKSISLHIVEGIILIARGEGEY